MTFLNTYAVAFVTVVAIMVVATAVRLVILARQRRTIWLSNVRNILGDIQATLVTSELEKTHKELWLETQVATTFLFECEKHPTSTNCGLLVLQLCRVQALCQGIPQFDK